MVEYLIGPIEKGLKDASSYVRTTAAMGVLKLYHLAPAVCNDHGYADTLKKLLIQDRDAQVAHHLPGGMVPVAPD